LNFKKNILIVGGTGFIGYHLASRSLKKGWQVVSISTKKPINSRKLPKVEYILCDITKKKLLKKKFRNLLPTLLTLAVMLIILIKLKLTKVII
tara:strand:- start:38 stop:316 length:279 start_codon:yes stop_codon:yes gene_type:complete